MARSKSASHVPIKPILYAIGSLVLGIVLLICSRLVSPDSPDASEQASATATAPADEAASESPPGGSESEDRQRAARNFSGFLLLFSMCGFVLCLVCIGWLVRDIRRARPAWKTQTKYPRMR